jgi:hypothetical protein
MTTLQTHLSDSKSNYLVSGKLFIEDDEHFKLEKSLEVTKKQRKGHNKKRAKWDNKENKENKEVVDSNRILTATSSQ